LLPRISAALEKFFTPIVTRRTSGASMNPEDDAGRNFYEKHEKSKKNKDLGGGTKKQQPNQNKAKKSKLSIIENNEDIEQQASLGENEHTGEQEAQSGEAPGLRRENHEKAVKKAVGAPLSPEESVSFALVALIEKFKKSNKEFRAYLADRAYSGSSARGSKLRIKKGIMLDDEIE